MKKVNLVDEFYYFSCPHCNEEIIVKENELNCRIFRHAYFKSNYQQVDPHLPKYLCDEYKNKDMVYGCCKPFEIINSNNNLYAIRCDYK